MRTSPFGSGTSTSLPGLEVHAEVPWYVRVVADARAAVEQVEREPVLGHRATAVLAAAAAAAPACEQASGELRARLMLRVALAQLALGDHDAADAVLEAAGRHAGDGAWRFLTGIRACRVAIRRGPAQRAEAEELIVAAAERDYDAADPAWQEVALELALAIGELAMHAEAADASAWAALRDVTRAVADDPARVDVAFTAHQLLATAALTEADARAAAVHFRALVAIAQRAASPADEIEARLALASVLADRDDPVTREEARVAVERSLDLAAEHELTELHNAALIAKAGVLAAAGHTAAALDRVLELARASVASQDLNQYVASVGIMSELYARAGDHVSAFRVIAESRLALARATGSDATPLFRPLLARLRDRIGETRLAKIAADVEQANRLADRLAAAAPRDPTKLE